MYTDVKWYNNKVPKIVYIFNLYKFKMYTILKGSRGSFL